MAAIASVSESAVGTSSSQSAVDNPAPGATQGDGRRVRVIASQYRRRGTKGDFTWMIEQPQDANTLSVYNENQTCFVEKFKLAGGGTAKLRPFRFVDPPRAAGVVTGNAKGFASLRDKVGGRPAKFWIDACVAEIKVLIRDNLHIQRVLYSGDAKTGTLGTRIFKVGDDVCDYIVAQLHALENIEFMPAST
jgi:hypothetical protein